MGKLTAIQVKNLGPGMHGDGESLYLAVTGKGGRSWVFRYREAGRLRDMGLGRLCKGFTVGVIAPMWLGCDATN